MKHDPTAERPQRLARPLALVNALVNPDHEEASVVRVRAIQFRQKGHEQVAVLLYRLGPDHPVRSGAHRVSHVLLLIISRRLHPLRLSPHRPVRAYFQIQMQVHLMFLKGRIFG